MVEVLAYVGGSSKNPTFAATSSNPVAQAAASGSLQVGPTTNYGPAVVISYGGDSATLAPSSYSALGAGGGVITAEQAYLLANSDVAASVSSGRFQTGLQHYLLYGAAEGRFYAGVGAQSFTAEQLYLEENGDVANAVRSGNYRSGLEHFLLYGAKEGRFYFGQSGGTLSAEQMYLNENADVRQGIARGYFTSGLDHFYKMGRSEGRFYAGLSYGPPQSVYVPTVQATQNGTTVNLTPDQQYLLSNPTAAQAVASGRYRDGLQYFLNEGYVSGSYRNLQGWTLAGQTGSAERAYLIANSDIAEAVASGLVASGKDHYFTYGKNEGFRSGYGQLTSAAYNANTADGGYLRTNQGAALAVATGQYATGFDYFLNVGASSGQNYGALTGASLSNGVGERAYLTQNRDVAAAVASGQVASGLQHFLDVGYREGRTYGNLTGASLTSGPLAGFERGYLQSYSDAAQAVANGQFSSAFDYFVKSGVDRGQVFGALNSSTIGNSLDRNYLLQNRDVAAAVASRAVASARQHFLDTGYREGRNFGALRGASLASGPTADLDRAYLRHNPDALDALANGQYGTALEYFAAVGAGRGQAYGKVSATALSDPNERAYLLANKDVIAGIANGYFNTGLEHFLAKGYQEGRGNYGALKASVLTDPALGAVELAYLRANADVTRAVVAGTYSSGLAHFLTSGGAEGRQYGSLSVQQIDFSTPDGQYVVAHADAAAAIAKGEASSGLDYFLKTGIDKGQSFGRLSAATLGAANDPERQYLSANRDVALAVANGSVASGLSHYLAYGYKDRPGATYGNLTAAILNPNFLEGQYLRATLSAANAVARGQAASGVDYFLKVGLDQGQTYGRLTAEKINGLGAAERAYLKQNLDVARNVASPNGFESGLSHYLTSGYADTRRSGYGALNATRFKPGTAEFKYLSANPDAAQAVANGTAADGFAYFVTTGAAKGQSYGKLTAAAFQANGAVERDYLLANRDVANAVGLGVFTSGLDHFLKVGRTETRTYGQLRPEGLQGTVATNAELAYLTNNRDVAQAVAEGRFATGLQHFLTAGKAEGRAGYGNLTPAILDATGLEGEYLRHSAAALQAVASGTAKSGLDYFLKTGAAKGELYGRLTAASMAAVGPAEQEYLSRNLDVAAAVAEGTVASGFDHFVNGGHAQAWRGLYGQLRADFYSRNDLQGQYLQTNKDAAKAVADGSAINGLDYFLKVGADKGQTYGALTLEKLGPAGSAERDYLTKYQNAAAAVAAGTFTSGLDHYLRSGYVDSRVSNYGTLTTQGASPTFVFNSVDGKYLRANLDAATAVATGKATSGVDYFLTVGVTKGQTYGSLNAGTAPTSGPEADYLKAHVDVAQKVASGAVASGLVYFLTTGADQGHSYGKIAAGKLGGATDPDRQYLTKYLDVAAAVGAGYFDSGLTHYVAHGRAAGYVYPGALTSALEAITITPNDPDSIYLVQHQAALLAVAKGEAKSGLDYFLKVGIDKGDTYGLLSLPRVGGPTSLERQYLTRNLDVAAAVAKGTYVSGVAHYLDAGFKQAWRGSYGKLDASSLSGSDLADAERSYLQGNLDVAAAIADGTYVGSGLTHYIQYGFFYPNRVAFKGLKDDAQLKGQDGYTESAYLLKNLDVAKAIVAGTYTSGLAHYLEVGRTQAWRGNYGALDPSKLAGSALADVERQYLRDNLDVGLSIAAGSFKGDGLQHYLQWGYKDTWRKGYGGIANDPARGYIDEMAYLQQHRSVAEQVALGGLDSGLFHFMRYGAVEGANWGGYTLNDIKNNFYRFSLDVVQVADGEDGLKSNNYFSALLLMANQNNIIIGDALSKFSAETFIENQNVSREVGNAYVIAAALGFNIDGTSANRIVNNQGSFDGPGLEFLQGLANYKDPTLVETHGLEAPQKALAVAPIAVALPFVALAPTILTGVIVAAIAIAVASVLVGSIHVLSSPPAAPTRTPQQRVADIAQGKLGCDNLPGASQVNQPEGRSKSTNADMSNAEFNEFIDGLRDTLTPGGWSETKLGKTADVTITNYFDKNGNIRFSHRVEEKTGKDPRHVVDIKDETGKRDVEKCHLNQRGKGGNSSTVPTLEKLYRIGLIATIGRDPTAGSGGDNGNGGSSAGTTGATTSAGAYHGDIVRQERYGFAGEGWTHEFTQFTDGTITARDYNTVTKETVFREVTRMPSNDIRTGGTSAPKPDPENDPEE